MKKLLALMVALLMVVLPVATAETVITFSNPVLTVNDNTYDLTGYEVAIAAGKIGDIDAYHVVISHAGTSVAIEANIVGNTAYAMVNGKVFSAPMSAKATSDLLNESGIDVEAQLNKLMSYATIDGNSFRLSYTALNQFLDSLLPTLQSANLPNVDISSLSKLLERAKNSNSGVNLEGTFVESGDSSELNAKAYVVRNGVAHTNPVMDLDITAGQDSVSISADAGARGNARFSMTADQITAAASARNKTVSGRISYDVREADVNLVAVDTTNAVDARSVSKSKLFSLLNSASGGKFKTLYDSAAGVFNSMIKAINAAA